MNLYPIKEEETNFLSLNETTVTCTYPSFLRLICTCNAL